MPNLTIRNVSDTALSRFREGASLRGISQAQYLEKLLDLHQELRSFSEPPPGVTAPEIEYVQYVLRNNGLETVNRSA